MPIDVEQAYTVYGPMVLRRCTALLGSGEEGHDLMQDVFVQLMRQQDVLHDRHLSSLLWTMATRLCLNRLRQRRARGVTLDQPVIDALLAVDDGHRLEARFSLTRLLGRMPADAATVAVMHWVDGMTLEEVAAAVGLSVSAVRRRLRSVQACVTPQEDVAHE